MSNAILEDPELDPTGGPSGRSGFTIASADDEELYDQEEEDEIKPLARKSSRADFSERTKRAIAEQKKMEREKQHQRNGTATQMLNKNLRVWLSDHNDVYAQALHQAVLNGSFVDNSGGTVSGRSGLAQTLLDYRVSLVREGLEDLSRCCIGEVCNCMTQLSQLGSRNRRHVATPDVNVTVDSFYELYDVLFFTAPWKNEVIAADVQNQLQERLQSIHKEIDEARTVYIRDSKEGSGVTEQGNASSILQTLTDQLLKLSALVDSCNVRPREKKSFFSFGKS